MCASRQFNQSSHQPGPVIFTIYKIFHDSYYICGFFYFLFVKIFNMIMGFLDCFCTKKCVANTDAVCEVELTTRNHDTVKRGRGGIYQLQLIERAAGVQIYRGPQRQRGKCQREGPWSHTRGNTQDQCRERTNKSKRTFCLQERQACCYPEGGFTTEKLRGCFTILQQCFKSDFGSFSTRSRA